MQRFPVKSSDVRVTRWARSLVAFSEKDQKVRRIIRCVICTKIQTRVKSTRATSWLPIVLFIFFMSSSCDTQITSSNGDAICKCETISLRMTGKDGSNLVWSIVKSIHRQLNCRNERLCLKGVWPGTFVALSHAISHLSHPISCHLSTADSVIKAWNDQLGAEWPGFDCVSFCRFKDKHWNPPRFTNSYKVTTG